MAWLLTWLVQGMAIALIARVAFRALPGLSAATRCTMWWAALVLVLILPIVGGVTADARTGASVGADTRVAVGASVDTSASMSAAANETGGALRSLPSLPPVSLPRAPDWLVSIAIGLWLGFVMVGLAQIVYSVHAVRRLKESCRRMVAPRESELAMWSAVRERGRAVRVRTSDRVRTAAVLGLTRPIIAVPSDAAAALTPHEIDQVVLHEYAHVQRYDDWTKLLQVLIGAFFGWHPAVRLMMREIDFEREAACDDYVVDVTGAPRAYARCLTKVIEMMPGPGLAAVPHVSSSARSATTRIERLLDRRRPSGRLALMPAMAGSLTLAALAFCTVHALPIATDHPGHLPTSGATAANAEVVKFTEVAVTDAASSAGDVADRSRREARRLDLRVAGAGTLPIALPFSRFSPLSRLTDARLPVSRAAASLPASPTPPSASPSTSTNLGHAAPSSTSAATPEARDAAATPVANAATTHTPAATEPAKSRDDSAGSHPRRSGRPAADLPRAEANFALGPVGSAADSDAMPEASESGHIGRAWENTRDATSKAMGVGARAVGSATKTAGDATKTATNKAAAGVKVSREKTARVLGRVKRTLASVF